ncbi:DUF6891 domain-containing protein [Streptomyces sp. NPDC058409]|uniref:DUF6891 domain-containing protein n=1 Tax=Streptomyces sp. NPDC058409 TaxID=3346484 RepID=UPI0036672138
MDVFVALAGAGTIQSDGFDDCTEVAHARGAALVGFCYCMRQDAERARDTGHLTPAFRGAPDGSTRTMEHTGGIVVQAFRAAGFHVDRNGTGNSRPSVALTGRRNPAEPSPPYGPPGGERRCCSYA